MTTEFKLFDLALLEEIDDASFITEVIGVYLLETPAEIREMASAWKSGNLEAVYKTAHKLKSSTGMLQANSLLEILEQTELLAKSSSQYNLIGELINLAAEEYEALKFALQLHLDTSEIAA